MRVRTLTFSAFFLISLISIGCGGGGVSQNSPGANNSSDSNTPPKDNANSAPTLTPVFKAYCDAMVKKDEAALRKVYSADTLKYFEEDMKEQKIKSLVKYLEDDAVSGNICEVRNEVITGDKAVGEIRADKYPNGIKIIFVKENGEWKLTTQSPSVDNVKQNSNTAAVSPAANKDNKDNKDKK